MQKHTTHRTHATRDQEKDSYKYVDWYLNTSFSTRRA